MDNITILLALVGFVTVLVLILKFISRNGFLYTIRNAIGGVLCIGGFLAFMYLMIWTVKEFGPWSLVVYLVIFFAIGKWWVWAAPRIFPPKNEIIQDVIINKTNNNLVKIREDVAERANAININETNKDPVKIREDVSRREKVINSEPCLTVQALKQLNNITVNYGDLLRREANAGRTISDESLLPLPKTTMKSVLQKAIGVYLAYKYPQAHLLMQGYLHLAYFRSISNKDIEALAQLKSMMSQLKSETFLDNAPKMLELSQLDAKYRSAATAEIEELRASLKEYIISLGLVEHIPSKDLQDFGL